MDLYELMENRRSTREFYDKKVSEEKLRSILKAGLSAPSGADQKPFVCIVVVDPVLKKKIKSFSETVDKKYYSTAPEWFKKWMKNKSISLEKNFLVDATFLIVVAGETDKPYWSESTWISIAYMILAAENEGLASLTYTPAETDFLNNLLHLPQTFKPVVIIPIGYAKNKASKKTAVDGKKVFLNKYSKQYFR
jgi:nitroreductase